MGVQEAIPKSFSEEQMRTAEQYSQLTGKTIEDITNAIVRKQLDFETMQEEIRKDNGQSLSKGSNIVVKVKDILPNPYQPRKTFDEASIDELAASIKESGLIQPPVIRMNNKMEYFLVAGERRLRAIIKLGWVDTEVRLVQMSEEQAAVASMLENDQRQDVNMLEKAQGLKTMIDKLGYSQAQAAKLLGVTQAKVSQTLSLLDLIKPIQEMIINKEMSQSLGRVVAQLPLDAQNKILPLLDRLTVAEAQILVNLYKGLLQLKENGSPGNVNMMNYNHLKTVNNESFLLLLEHGFVDVYETALEIFSSCERDKAKIDAEHIPTFRFLIHHHFVSIAEHRGQSLGNLAGRYDLTPHVPNTPNVLLRHGAKAEASETLRKFLVSKDEAAYKELIERKDRVVDRVKSLIQRSNALAVHSGIKTTKGKALLKFTEKVESFLGQVPDNPEHVQVMALIKRGDELLDEYDDLYVMPMEKDCTFCYKPLGDDVVYDGNKGPYHESCLKEKKMLDRAEGKKRSQEIAKERADQKDVEEAHTVREGKMRALLRTEVESLHEFSSKMSRKREGNEQEEQAFFLLSLECESFLTSASSFTDIEYQEKYKNLTDHYNSIKHLSDEYHHITVNMDGGKQKADMPAAGSTKSLVSLNFYVPCDDLEFLEDLVEIQSNYADINQYIEALVLDHIRTLQVAPGILQKES